MYAQVLLAFYSSFHFHTHSTLLLLLLAHSLIPLVFLSE
jgi:hypothetical protein